MLESQAMKAALSLWRWFLFLTATWIVYNSPLPSFLVFSIMQNISQGFDARHAIITQMRGGWDGFYGFGSFIPTISELLNPKIWWLSVPLCLYALIANAAAYLWLRRQNIARAWLLAMAGCFAGPYTLVLFENPLLWLYGFMGACIFFILLFAADIFLEKYFFAAP